MATQVQTLIFEPPTSPVHETKMHSNSDKAWTSSYPWISDLRVHSQIMNDGSVFANFDTAFFPEADDDVVRLGEMADRPNYRSYRLYSEQDGGVWFHTEISNIVLAAFRRWPPLQQTAEDPPTPETSKLKFVDISYAAKMGHDRKVHVALGEFKRNLINADAWLAGRLTTQGQRKLSRELRGYECSLIFCFDHEHLLLLQFRAASVSGIRDDGPVDCWVIPRINPNGTTIRYALYRMLVQGFRRFQGMYRTPMSFPGAVPDGNLFYNGLPLWRVNGSQTSNPFGYSRKVNPTTGALYWVDESGNMLMDANGNAICDTTAFWS